MQSDDLEDIKKNIVNIQKTIARKEYERDAAIAARNKALDDLRQMGFSSETEAKNKLLDLKEALIGKIDNIDKQLKGLE